MLRRSLETKQKSTRYWKWNLNPRLYTIRVLLFYCLLRQGCRARSLVQNESESKTWLFTLSKKLYLMKTSHCKRRALNTNELRLDWAPEKGLQYLLNSQLVQCAMRASYLTFSLFTTSLITHYTPLSRTFIFSRKNKFVHGPPIL